jgi:hypothetical protein
MVKTNSREIFHFHAQNGDQQIEENIAQMKIMYNIVVN